MAILPVSIDGDGYDHYPRDDDGFEQPHVERPVKLAEDFDFAESYMNDQSAADEAVDYSEIIADSAFLGDFPFSSITEGIETQFNDYINMEDKNNYVDIFYDQLHASYEEATKDPEHPQELKDALDKILDTFIDNITQLFAKRLTITINAVEAEDIDQDEVELVLRRLYEFFILGARENFKVVIAADINYKTFNEKVEDNDAEFFNKIERLLSHYSPLILEIGPMEFLKYRGDEEIYGLFESGKVNGNFLRKYSPKLYQNEEFKVELINHIVIVKEVKEELMYEPK